MYVIQAQVTTKAIDKHGVTWYGSQGLPTFYLHPDVQGIVSCEHAEKIARSMFAPFMRPGDEFFPTVTFDPTLGG